MNDRIKTIIELVRNKLSEEQNGIVIGQLGEENQEISNNNEQLDDYFDFLNACDGARCGAIDSEIVPDAHLDDWYQFLEKIGLA